jgi:alpha-tubulin suppressor-like RCC1 family protein
VIRIVPASHALPILLLAGLAGAACSDESSTPPGIDIPIALKAGATHNCALFRSGLVRCWGGNNCGALGDGHSAVDKNRPVLVEGVAQAVELALGAEHSCVRVLFGGEMCWGDNLFGAI